MSRAGFAAAGARILKYGGWKGVMRNRLLTDLKRFSVLLLLVFGVAGSHGAPAEKEGDFSLMLKKAKMKFVLPPEYIAADVVPDEQQNYHHAIRHRSLKMEVRYYIDPLDMAAYRRSLEPGSNIRLVNPNNLHGMVTQTIVENLTGTSKVRSAGTFPPAAVKNEFGADWGASYLLMPVTGKFGAGFKLVSLVVLHREDVADAYIFFLFDDFTVYQQQMRNFFYALRFE